MSDTANRGRREFLGLGLLAAAGWSRIARGEPSSPEAGEPLAELAYGQVQFSAGPLARQARENHRLVLGLG
jgi:hypothetical protein